MKSIPTDFYKSTAWKRCRAAYMRYSGGLCERCAAEGKIVPAEIVHHKEHLNLRNFKDPSVAFAFENLEALCMDCHNKEHFKAQTARRWKFESDGLNISGDKI